MESLTNWCVYMHENRKTGKKYLGITGNRPTRKWANGKLYETCKVFNEDIQRYGWDAFRHEILYTDLTQEQAESLCKRLITKYKTNDPAHGYNCERR